MAGSFLIQKFSSQTCRSRSLFSAAARTSTPASVARSFNTFPCSRLATKTNCSTTSMPSINISRLMKPACADSSGGAKGSFSSTRQEISRSAKRAAWAAEWDAKSAARQAQRAAWAAEIEKKVADFDKFVTNQMLLWWGLTGSIWIFAAFIEEENGTSFCNGQSCSCGCSSCCNGQCVFSKS